MLKKINFVILLFAMTLMFASCSNNSNKNNIENTTNVKVENSIKKSESSLKLKKYLDDDPKLMAMMEKSIKLAHEINPDKETNPVSNVIV